MKLNECKGYEEWMIKFITTDYVKVSGELVCLYTAWDETQEYTLTITYNKQEVVDALRLHVDLLNKVSIKNEVKSHPQVVEILKEAEEKVLNEISGFVFNLGILPENVHKLTFNENVYGEIDVTVK